uniref:Uncharacterized protein n=1 Tax=Arundo donax TaxID=35708 RepID=A0A0A9HGD6_ARUDO
MTRTGSSRRSPLSAARPRPSSRRTVPQPRQSSHCVCTP